MPIWRSFQYREFWDQPRIIYIPSQGEDPAYLLACHFDDSADAYPEHYQVYLMPQLPESDLSGSWDSIEKLAIDVLGKVRISRSAFDPSLRTQIDMDILKPLMVSPHDQQ